ncbi:MAG: hypothetical protein KDE35_18760 [Geminicoccaceae bacterium]|nr:hypothetical protein [Geminicoccaceae bacterium]
MCGVGPYPLVIALGTCLALSACAVPDPVDLAAMDALECTEAGFEPDTDTYRLCLMLQAYDRRLRSIETRLGFIELDSDRFGLLPRHRRFPYH